MRMKATKLGIALHRRPAVVANIDDRDTIDDATIILGPRLQNLDHEPLIGMNVTHVGPAHVPTVLTDPGAGNFSDKAASAEAYSIGIMGESKWRRRE